LSTYNLRKVQMQPIYNVRYGSELDSCTDIPTTEFQSSQMFIACICVGL